MGIGLATVHLLSRTFNPLGELAGRKLLTLGVQDCYFTHRQLLAFFRRHQIPCRDTTPRLKESVGPSFLHPDTFFNMLGFRSVQAMDVSDFEGAGLVHDLNLPVSESLHSGFDVIFDGGTIEHVFSLKDAFFNLARICRLGGLVIHHSPLDFINHGFVNLNAEIFRDFYTANGFEQLELKYVLMPRHQQHRDRHYIEFDPELLRFSLNPYYLAGVYAVFRKRENVELRVPKQGFYEGVHRGERPQVPQRSGLRAAVVDLIDRSLTLSFLARADRTVRKGKRVDL